MAAPGNGQSRKTRWVEGPFIFKEKRVPDFSPDLKAWVSSGKNKMKEEGKDQASYWIDAELIERIKTIAQVEKINTSDLVNKLLLESLACH